MASSQGDVRSSPMAYPAVRSLPKLPLLLCKMDMHHEVVVARRDDEEVRADVGQLVREAAQRRTVVVIRDALRRHRDR
eukprot:scaffold23825_cov35-Phaeocystis_antarctica.AAC.2